MSDRKSASSGSMRTSLRVRFVLGTGVMLLPLLLLAAFGYSLLQRTIDSFDTAMHEVSTDLAAITLVQNLLLKSSMPVNDYLLHGRRRDREAFLDLSQRIDEAFNNAVDRNLSHAEDRTIMQAARAHWEEAHKLGSEILALPYPVNDTMITGKTERIDGALDRAIQFLGQVYEREYREIAASHAQAQQNKRTAQVVIATMFGIAVLVAISTGFVLARKIFIPIRKLEEGAARFGAGDLSHRVSLSEDDALGSLATTFNTMAGQLEKIATHDALTGLYNYREFHRRLEEEIARNQRYGHPFSLLMMDIDHFKVINDTYGHLAGDSILRAVADRIIKQVRPVDHVARYGGEELVALLPQTDGSDSMVTAERIRNAIAASPFSIDGGQSVDLTVSIGLAGFPGDADSNLALLNAADRALYAAKSAGRNQVCRFVGN